MAVVYLRHPTFGAKVATMEAEVEYDKENGWEEFDPAIIDDEPPKDDVEVLEVVNELQPKRRGRPPREIAA